MTRNPAGLTLPPRPGLLLDENAGSTLSENQQLYYLKTQQMKLDSDNQTPTYLTLPVTARHIAEKSGAYTFRLGFMPSGGHTFRAEYGTDLEVTRVRR